MHGVGCEYFCVIKNNAQNKEAFTLTDETENSEAYAITLYGNDVYVLEKIYSKVGTDLDRVVSGMEEWLNSL